MSEPAIKWSPDPRGDDDLSKNGGVMTSALVGVHGSKRIVKGIAVAMASFAGLGTVSALWENPLFIRMTPAGGWEVAFLAALSLLLGAYMAIRRPLCSVKAAGAGGVLGFLGVACPVCNKILLLMFGGELLLAYFEPVRVYVAAFGVLITLAAVLREGAMVRKNAGAPREGTERSRRAHGHGAEMSGGE